MATTEEMRAQVIAQYKAVSHMALALEEVHRQATGLIDRMHDDALRRLGQRSHYFMDLLGDCLNGMDAVTDEDRWITPVFERARNLFPIAPEPADGDR